MRRCTATCRIRIPAREVILAGRPPDAISLHNIVPGTVRRIAGDPARRSVLVEVALPSGALLARVTPDAIVRLALAPGGPVLALIKSTSIEGALERFHRVETHGRCRCWLARKARGALPPWTPHQRQSLWNPSCLGLGGGLLCRYQELSRPPPKPRQKGF